MVIIVFGGTGFVGRHLIPKLVESYDTYVVIRSYERARDVFSKYVLKSVKLVKGDLSFIDESLKSEIRNIDNDLTIVNLVGKINLSSNARFFDDLYLHNVKTLINLLKVLELTGKIGYIKSFLHFSSIAAFGALNPSSSITPNTGCMPVLPYEISKLESERVLKKYLNFFKIIILRAPMIYGKGSKEFMNMLRLMRLGIFPAFKGNLPLIHVDDLANIVLVILKKIKKLGRFELFLPVEDVYSYDEIVDLVRKHFGRGRTLDLPYSVMQLFIRSVEIVYRFVGKREPMNTYRLKSAMKKKFVIDDRFNELIGYRFRWNLDKFLSSLR